MAQNSAAKIHLLGFFTNVVNWNLTAFSTLVCPWIGFGTLCTHVFNNVRSLGLNLKEWSRDRDSYPSWSFSLPNLDLFTFCFLLSPTRRLVPPNASALLAPESPPPPWGGRGSSHWKWESRHLRFHFNPFYSSVWLECPLSRNFLPVALNVWKEALLGYRPP